MKKILLTILFVFTITTFTTKIASAEAFGVVNIVKIMDESKAVQDIKQQVTIYKSSLEKQAQKKQQELKSNEQDLIKKQKDLSQNEFEKAKQEFQLKVQNTQKGFYEKSQNLDKVSNEALMNVQQKVSEIIASVAKSKKLDIIYQSNALVYFDKSKDISDEIISKLNASLSKVKVNKPF